MNSTRSYQESLLEDLSNPIVASEYLNAAKEDSREMFLVALKDVAQARQMTKVAKEAGVQRETLYRSLSSTGNPTLETFDSVLEVLGLEFLIIPKKAAASPVSVSYTAAKPLGLVWQGQVTNCFIDTSYGSSAQAVCQIVSIIPSVKPRLNQGTVNI